MYHKHTQISITNFDINLLYHLKNIRQITL